jgi:hypothetical protein
MPSSSSFTGTGLSLQSVNVLNNGNVLRVRFTNDPKQSNPASINDATNPSLWTLSGPGYIAVSSVNTVGGDSQSVDLLLSVTIPTGNWTITAAGTIQAFNGTAISSPTSLQFTVSEYLNVSEVNPGSANDECESIIRKHHNPALRGPGWDALIAGLADGDCTNFDNIKLAFNQLYKISANGIYLDRITANDGIVRPKNIGISDDIYRQLAIKITNNKIVTEAILEVLAVYYGEDALRAHATTANYEPFNLSSGDDFDIIIDGLYQVKVTFNNSEFSLISAAKASEVAAAITRAFIIAGIKAFALSFVDPADNKSKVKIYTNSLGLKGTVQIISGKAQNTLKFQTLLNIYTGVV